MNINIETKNVIKIFTIAVLFTIGVFGLMKMYDTLVLVLTAFFFALALNPAVSFISRFMPKRKRGPAVALVMVAAFALISFLAFSIITPVAREASDFAANVPVRIDEIRKGENTLGKFINRYKLDDDIERTFTSLKNNVDKIGQTAVNRVGQFGNGVLLSITGMVITILMLLNGPGLLKKASNAIYRDTELQKRHELLAGKMYNVVTGYVNGQVLVALIASSFALGALFILKVPYPLPLASIVFAFGLIPLIGNTIAAVLVVLFSLVLKDLTTSIILIAFFIVYQQIENATLQPMVQGRTTQLPTLVIFISVILGVSLMGPVGGLFAIPLAGCAKILIVDYLEHRSNLPEAPSDLAGKIKHHVKKAVSK
jgi:predicted PurR-regulated permease PerM